MRIPGMDHSTLIPPGSSDPRITARMGILHVAATNATSLYSFFNGPSGGIESHAYILKNGHSEQYRDTAFQADANLKANDFALSFETQGLAEEIWTNEQIAEIQRVMLWAAKPDTHSIPLCVPTTWNDPRGGWGYHTLFGAPSPWTPVAKSCPGPRRIEQFHDVLVPWMKKVGKDDMFNSEDSERLQRVEDSVTGIEKALGKFRENEAKRDKALRLYLKEKFKATDAQLDEILGTE